MNRKSLVVNSFCFLLLTILVFSVWVAFALLVINPYLHPFVPGYQVGNPCGWELVALFASLFTAYRWRKSWQQPCCKFEKNTTVLCVSNRFTYFALLYVSGALVIFLWQYLLFAVNN